MGLDEDAEETTQRLLLQKAPILKFFEYRHLPPELQALSKQVCELAFDMARKLPQGAELSAGLRKLLEAKDCFVRARLP